MLRACGITAFLTPLPPLASPSTPSAGGPRLSAAATDRVSTPVRCATGDLKNVPEDFVVVEVDPTGQRTDADDYNFVSASTSNPPSSVTADPVDDGAEAGTVSGPEAALGLLPPVLPPQVKSPGACSRSVQALRSTLTAHTPELQRCFGTVAEVATRVSSAFTQAALSLLLRDIRAAAQGSSTAPREVESTASCAAGASLPWWRAAAHTLGHFADKRERQLMHLMVRWCFPHLRACADAPPLPRAADGISSGDGNASVISCSLDLHYVLFCATLGCEAALCIARWSVEAQAARQERSLSDEDRAELRELLNSDDSEAWPGLRARTGAAAKGFCSTSFDSLTEAMRRQPPDEPARRIAAESMPLVSEKDVRRQVHELLRRFYPFVHCQVRGGHATLRFHTRPDGGNDTLTSDAAARSRRNAGTGVGARRTRAEMEGRLVDASPLSAGSVSNSAAPAYVHIVVRKRNLDTAEMRQLLGEYFGVKESSVCVAGMKDKRAVSVQRCSVPVVATGGEAHSRVRALLTDAAAVQPVTLRWPADPQQSYAVLLRASASSVPVHLGQLSGNWFSLRVRDAGFINYFGQQRFSETVGRVDDHTGVHLFAARWVAAVRSLYRACPDVYNAFPDKMEARFVSSNSRDAQVMTHALRQTYRMYFSDCPLSSADVQNESEVWTRLCEKAITEGVPFYLRSLWVHAGQSVFFNLAASYLPLGGYHVDRAALGSIHLSDPASAGLWAQWKDAAIQHALRELRWTSAQGFEQRRVAGVPVPGSWRAVVARPTDASLEWEAEARAETQRRICSGGSGDASADAVYRSTMQLSFALPPSCYATVFLREVLGCDKWW
ncbi:tRNA pseudouridine synthase D (TruD) family protein [Leishmania donovani]|uniref:tRNA pseudouridine synthase D (TruD) family protein n=1 Tax=Leishmania donovani TaxID=5661 RepID=A0A504XQH4_LEIDO|nr:tRNA pseudouridine synthase D (TruD) family protein [Leishmania donovani]